mmetsp:Transcript_3336/g.8582  ORF Transcript_3336/g.8582 Transcript_3336/m.8582 type:complete len:268 (+) Transcript_3336:71-874(+)
MCGHIHLQERHPLSVWSSSSSLYEFGVVCRRRRRRRRIQERADDAGRGLSRPRGQKKGNKKSEASGFFIRDRAAGVRPRGEKQTWASDFFRDRISVVLVVVNRKFDLVERARRVGHGLRVPEDGGVVGREIEAVVGVVVDGERVVGLAVAEEVEVEEVAKVVVAAEVGVGGVARVGALAVVEGAEGRDAFHANGLARERVGDFGGRTRRRGRRRNARAGLAAPRIEVEEGPEGRTGAARHGVEEDVEGDLPLEDGDAAFVQGFDDGM